MVNIIHFVRTEAPLLAPIFRSDGQARLLAALVLTGDELSISELSDRAELAYATTHREVLRLVDAGILVSRTVGRTRLISANRDSPLTSPLREILAIVAGPVAALRHEFGAIEGIVSAFLYGSFAARIRGVAGPDPRDIDVMVVGAPQADLVYEACARVEELMKRPVNPTIFAVAEFGKPSAFIDSVRAGSVVPVLGEALWR